MQRTPHRVHGYARVSSDEQGRHGTSLAAQEEEIRRYAASRGWPEPIVRREIESGSSERLESRVALRELLADVRPGEAVLVSRVDRWGRDLVHVVASVRELVARDVTWIAIGDSLDASTAHGQSTLGIMAWASDQERTRIWERTVGRKRSLRDAGCWPEGKAPRGYTRDRATRRLVVEPEGAALVRDVYARCLAGESIAALSRHLRTGGHTWADKKAVHRLLTSRWYLGEMRRTDGVWVPAHEPLVDASTFARAAEALAGRRLGGAVASATSRTHGWLLRGLARCGSCGSRMGSAYSRAEAGDGYYACAARLRGEDCDEPYARVRLVDERAGAAVLARLEELRRELSRARPLRQQRADEGRVEALRAAVEAARTRRARAVSLLIDGLLGADEGRRRIGEIDRELAHLDAELRAAEAAARPLDGPERAAVLADVAELRRRWTGLPVPARRAIVALLAERVEVHDGEPRAVWRDVAELSGAATVGTILRATTAATPPPPDAAAEPAPPRARAARER